MRQVSIALVIQRIECWLPEPDIQVRILARARMKVSVLFSGGKDSSLAAIMLSKIFEVELVTCNFGILSAWKQAEKIAKKLGFPFRILKLNKSIIEEAVVKTIADGFPNNGIKHIHKRAIEEAAKESKIIGDGIRRNDRVPVLSLPEIMRLEDKFNIHYIQPLMGYSRKTIDILVEKYLVIEEHKSDSFTGAEYEFELRELIKREYGIKKIREIFPKNHTKSIVIKVK